MRIYINRVVSGNHLTLSLNPPSQYILISAKQNSGHTDRTSLTHKHTRNIGMVTDSRPLLCVTRAVVSDFLRRISALIISRNAKYFAKSLSLFVRTTDQKETRTDKNVRRLERVNENAPAAFSSSLSSPKGHTRRLDGYDRVYTAVL